MTDGDSKFWAERMFSSLGQIAAIELLQKAQNAAQLAGHEFCSGGSDAPLADLEGEVKELLEAIGHNHWLNSPSALIAKRRATQRTIDLP